MERLTTTPFGRRVMGAGQIAAHMAAQTLLEREVSGCVDKWQILRDLTTARTHFGLGSRTLGLLGALLSFHPERTLAGTGPMVVFPSNRSLAERAHGMAEATLRRHLAALVDAGFLVRHDSPNGKRYATRDRSGAMLTAYGFDLRPLLVRAGEIADVARSVEDARLATKRLRDAVILCLRDITTLLDWTELEEPHQADLLDNVRKLLRRKPDLGALETARIQLDSLRKALRQRLETRSDTEELSGSAVETERHYQNSHTDYCESEQRCEMAQSPAETLLDQQSETEMPSLAAVLTACPSLALYADHPIRDWQGLHHTANKIAPWLGISRDAWASAQTVMGAAPAAVTLAAILERKEAIRVPGGYLRRLTQKATTQNYSPAPMVKALLAAQS